MALRILPSLPPGYLSPLAMRGLVPSKYPLLPLHGATCWLLVFCMFLVNFMCEMSACNVRGTNNMKQRASVHVWGNFYVDIFSRVPQEWTWVSTQPRGSLSQHPSKRVGILVWHIFDRSGCLDLDFHNTHGPPSP